MFYKLKDLKLLTFNLSFYYFRLASKDQVKGKESLALHKHMKRVKLLLLHNK